MTMTDPFALVEESLIPLESYGKQAAGAVYDSIQNASDATARSRQARSRVIGVSNIGHCREYMRMVILDTPDTEVRDKTAAFMGTVTGEAIEAQIKIDHPNWLTQVQLFFPLGEGGTVKGHADVIIPASEGCTVEEYRESLEEGYDGPPRYFQGVLDLKSKAELESIRRYGQSQQQRFQVYAYAKAAIEAGYLDPSKPIVVGDIFYDRSGRDQTPYPIVEEYRESVIHEIDMWMGDVIYAVRNGERASQDKPIEWCERFCELFTACRGGETEARTGLITDEDTVNQVRLYADGAAMARDGDKLKKLAKENLVGVEGSTGDYTVKQVEVGATYVPGFTRAGYTKIDVRKISAAAKKKAAKAAPQKETLPDGQ